MNDLGRRSASAHGPKRLQTRNGGKFLVGDIVEEILAYKFSKSATDVEGNYREHPIHFMIPQQDTPFQTMPTSQQWEITATQSARRV